MLKFIKAKNATEFYTQERCHIEELVNDADCPQMSLARCRVAGGVITQLHALDNVREVYLIEQGAGVMDDGINAGISVSVGDVIIIEPGAPQRIKNSGRGDLVFMVTCTPRFTPQCYRNLEENSDGT